MTPSTSAGPREHRFSTGDWLEAAGRVEGQLLLHSPIEKPRWKARLAGSHTHAEFPGTAIAYRDEYYEVTAVQATADGRGVVYTLSPWDDRHLLRAPQTLDEAALVALAEEFSRDQRPVPSILWLPWYGALPAEDQLRRESDDGVPATHATIASSVVGLAVALPTAAAAVLLLVDPWTFGAEHPELGWIRRTCLVWFYLLIESLVRLLVSLALHRPLGTLPLVLLWGIPRAVRQHRDESIQRAENRTHRPPDASSLLQARDRLHPLPATADSPEALEILSPLPKPDWVLGHTLVRIEGSCYLPTDREVLGTGPAVRHRFRLEPVETLALARPPYEYTTSDPALRAREIVRRRRAHWVEPLPFVWGFLDEGHQQRLERVFGHDPLPATQLNYRVTSVFATLVATVTLARLVGAVHVFDVLLLAVALAFLVEAPRRRREHRRGRVRGSWFGHLLTPAAERLLARLEGPGPPGTRNTTGQNER